MSKNEFKKFIRVYRAPMVVALMFVLSAILLTIMIARDFRSLVGQTPLSARFDQGSEVRVSGGTAALSFWSDAPFVMRDGAGQEYRCEWAIIYCRVDVAANAKSTWLVLESPVMVRLDANALDSRGPVTITIAHTWHDWLGQIWRWDLLMPAILIYFMLFWMGFMAVSALLPDKK